MKVAKLTSGEYSVKLFNKVRSEIERLSPGTRITEVATTAFAPAGAAVAPKKASPRDRSKIDLSDIEIPENAYNEIKQILQDLFTPLKLSVMLGNPGAAVASDLANTAQKTGAEDEPTAGEETPEVAPDETGEETARKTFKVAPGFVKQEFGLPNGGTISAKQIMDDLKGAFGQQFKDASFEDDWGEFIERLGTIKKKVGTEEQPDNVRPSPKLQEGTLTVAKMASAFGKEQSGAALQQLVAIEKEKDTGPWRILQALKRGGKIRDARVGVPFLKALLQSATKGAAMERGAEAVQESLLRESEIKRWQLIAGIKKSVI